ncbi:MAG: PAS domain S-box-containing protein [Candidatus Omnitrophota bacterium]|jgi:PAS domain S-box-containing protein
MKNLPIESALDATSCAIVIADAGKLDFPIVYVNKTFEKMTGYKSDEAVGQNCRFLQGSDCDQKGLRLIRKSLKDKKACVAVLSNYKKDGTLFWNELKLSPIFNPQGKLTHYVGIQTDITKEHEAQQELKKYQSQLEILVKERTEQVEQKNTALKELVGQVELEKKGYEKKIAQNVDRLIEPLLKKLARKSQSTKEKKLIELIQKNLDDISGGFGENLSRKLYSLSPREIELCNMIKNGLSSKDIASLLNTSHSTVENQRNTIRKKLGISTQSVNLATFLESIQ